MPPPGGPNVPYPDPVDFDHALAGKAAAAMRDAARLVQQLMGFTVQNGSKALQNWAGPHAERFRTDFGTQQRTGQQVVTDLLAWASRIDTAAANATAQQRRQDAANLQWRRDHPSAGGARYN